MPDSNTMTTAQAAKLAQVAPSTIKRWAEQGVLPSSRTVGGHRRFDRGAVERALRDLQGRASTPGDADANPQVEAWVAALLGAQRHEVEGCLLEARARLGNWSSVADEVAAALRTLGERWECGSLSIAEEHVASDCLARALNRVGDMLPSRPAAPRCVLATAAGDDHTLGLSLAELCLRELGWSVVWLGRNTPLEEVLRLVHDGHVELVALSASSACGDAQSLRQVCRRAAQACEARSVGLVLGGSGPWPEHVAGALRVATFAEFRDVVAGREMWS